MLIRRWRRLRRRDIAELNITAFMNLMVVLVPFLLITAVFSRMAVHELNVPAAAAGPVAREWRLQLVIRPGQIEVGDNQGQVSGRVPSLAGSFDYAALAKLVQAQKDRHAASTAAELLIDPAVPYDVVVQVMDRVRSQPAAGRPARSLFPDIAIGDAPSR